MKSLWLTCHPVKTQVPLVYTLGWGDQGPREMANRLAVLCSIRGVWDFLLILYMTDDIGHTHTHICPPPRMDMGQLPSVQNRVTLGLRTALNCRDEAKTKGYLHLSRGVGAGPGYKGSSDSPPSLHTPKSAKPASCATWRPTSTAPCVMCRCIKPGRC